MYFCLFKFNIKNTIKIKSFIAFINMPQVAHIKVLLKKDYLTLRRNIGFVFAFVVLPLGLMIAFCYL